MSELPIPLSNYLQLIRKKRSPYYDLLQYVISDMERRYMALEYSGGDVYLINPRTLLKQVEEKIPSDKITTVNIGRVMLAALRGSNLRKGKDYYVTTSSSGRKNYHIKLNSAVLAALRSNL
jgi:hypothetical protein